MSSLSLSLSLSSQGKDISSGSSSSPASVVIVGSANQDLTTYTPKVPVMGETVSGTDFQTSCGGKGANQAVAAACLLPSSSIRMVCKVGNDIYGQALLNNFDATGVSYDPDTVHAPEGVPTGVAPIIVDTTTGDNSIIVVPGANHALTKRDVQTAIDATADPGTEPQTPAIVLVQLEILTDVALEAMKAGKQVGACTILNPAPVPLGGLDPQFFKYVDILVPNETELRELYSSSSSSSSSTNDKDSDPAADEETMAIALLEKGIQRAVVVTLGARGAMVVSKNAFHSAGGGDDDDGDSHGEDDAFSIEYVAAPPGLDCGGLPVLSTVGAGDAFCGSLAAYLSTGRHSLAECASRACGIASMTVRKLGAQTSYPTPDEVPQCLRAWT